MLVLRCWCLDDVMACCVSCWCRCVGWWIDVLMCWRHCVAVLPCWSVEHVLRRWCADVLMCWCIDLLMSTHINVLILVRLMCAVDMLICWCVDVLMCWCVDVLIRWCVDVLSVESNRLLTWYVGCDVLIVLVISRAKWAKEKFGANLGYNFRELPPPPPYRPSSRSDCSFWGASPSRWFLGGAKSQIPPATPPPPLWGGGIKHWLMVRNRELSMNQENMSKIRSIQPTFMVAIRSTRRVMLAEQRFSLLVTQSKASTWRAVRAMLANYSQKLLVTRRVLGKYYSPSSERVIASNARYSTRRTEYLKIHCSVHRVTTLLGASLWASSVLMIAKSRANLRAWITLSHFC